MKKIIGFILIIPSLMMFSCKKQPTACLTVDKTTIAVGETVNFTSCATDAESISWDFGNGNKAEGNNVSQTFNTAGTYLVTMTAKSKNEKKWDKASVVINVKEPAKDRFITKISLKAFPSTPPQGGTWDTTLTGIPFSLPGNAPEPDLVVTFKTQDNTWSLDLGTYNDVKQSQLPLNWSFAQQWLRTTNENYQFVIEDNDFTLSGFNPIFYRSPMKTFTFNPKTATLNGNTLTINEDGYKLEITFEER